jgi:tetratricopeptide (TPR) repeat protein
MRKQLLTAFVILASANNGIAQEVSSTDLSRYELFEEGEVIATLTELQDMEDAYMALVADGNCGAALPVIIEFYEAANHVSNLIRRGNEPYYDASRDGKDSVALDGSLFNELLTAENTFNNLIQQRNRAWVEEAKCLLAEGERQEAITRLYRALDYISEDERRLWEEARTLLWAEVGFSTNN